MRILFLHPVFPGQFHRLMAHLAARPGHEILHLSRQSAMESVPGVRKFQYKVPEASSHGHPFASRLDEAVRHGEAVAKAALELRRRGFRPDLIYGYAGWGPTLFMKDVWPDVPLAGYFEWYLHAFGSEYNFDPEHPLAWERQLHLRIFNANMLLDLESCDHGLTPTHWQHSRFPAAYRSKLSVLHDGVDTGYFQPRPDAGLTLPGIHLPPGTPVVTYATRGMEPFRGFPQFMRALALLQQERPDVHAVIVGTDEVYYSRRLPENRTYKQHLLEELQGRLDLSRIHFTGWLDSADYLKVLQASTAHVYLTHPYVLSWSLMEAMSAGCLVVGSRTPPVEEVLVDGENGLLVDFFDPEALARRLLQALSPAEDWRPLRNRARQTILERYALERLLPRHAALVHQWAGRPA